MGSKRATGWMLCCLIGCGGPSAPTVIMTRVGPEAPVTAPVVLQERGTARAFVAQSPSDLLTGPAAGGEPGDLVLRNEHLVAVVRGAGHRGRVAPTGGHLIDLAPVGAEDALGEAALFLDPDGRAIPLFDEISVARDGRDGGLAIVRAAGHDARDEQVVVEVDYLLASGENRLRIITTVTHRGRSHYRDFTLGHWMSWGGLHPFVPGPGGDLEGQRTRSAWVGADAARGALLLAGMGTLLEAIHGRDFSQIIEQRTYLAPGAVVSQETSIHVAAEGGIAAAEAMLGASRQTVTGQVRGTLRERRRQRPVTDGWVLVASRDGAWVTRARVVAGGVFTLDVEPGHYRLVAVANGRAPAPPVEVKVEADGFVEVPLVVEPPGRLRLTVNTTEGAPLPARVALVGRKGTPTPTLGPPHALPLAGNAVYAVQGRFNGRVPPGDYVATIGAGPLYGRATREITVRAGESTRLEITLPREVDAPGWTSVDPRVHTMHGATSAVTAADRVGACRTEGVQAFIALDERGGEPYGTPAPPVVALRGLEVPTSDARLAALPLAALPVLPARLPANAAEGLPFLRGLPGRPLVAVFRPRARGIGYFERFAFDPRAEALPRGGFSLDFDAIEVLPAGVGPEADATLTDYLGLLARGRRPIPLGASGSDELASQPCGSPRTWVHAEVRDAPTLEAALRQTAVVASAGPLVWLGAPAAPGELLQVDVRAAEWTRPATLRLQHDAGPPIAVELPAGRGPLEFHRALPWPTGATWVVAVTDGPRRADPLTPNGIRPLAVTSPALTGVETPGR